MSQGDRRGRAVSCHLMENNVPWVIPDGASARIAYTLPDGTEGLYDRRPDGTPMWEVSGNIVTAILADQLMDQVGVAQISILVIGPDGGQLATWPIRVCVTANKAARLTVPENLPPYGAGFVGKIFFGGADGTITPLELGPGLEIRNGVLYVTGATEPEKPLGVVTTDVVDGDFRVYLDGVEIVPVLGEAGDMTWPGLTITVDSSGNATLKGGTT